MSSNQNRTRARIAQANAVVGALGQLALGGVGAAVKKKATTTTEELIDAFSKQLMKQSKSESKTREAGPPVISSYTSVKAKPLTSKAASGIRIRNRELINGSVLGSVAFAVTQSFSLQPGMSTTFPWLSVQAAQYEQYRFHSLRFVYIPSTPTASGGDVLMMTDYNAMDPQPLTEVQFVDHPGSLVGAVWEAHTFNCTAKEMHAIGPRKFVRTVAMAGDPKTFDCGMFYLGAVACASAAAIGKLFVEYDVEFFTPQLIPNQAALPTLHNFAIVPGTQTLATTVVTAVRFNYLSNLLGFAVGSPLTSQTPPAGCYKVICNLSVQDSVSELVNCQLVPRIGGVLLTTPNVSINVLAPCASGGVNNITYTGIISFDGVKTFEMCCTMIAAAGVLTIISGNVILSLA